MASTRPRSISLPRACARLTSSASAGVSFARCSARAAHTTQERRCAHPKPGCFGLPEEENCKDTAYECAEFDYSGDDDPEPPHCTPPNCMTLHPPPGNIDLQDTPPADPDPLTLGDYPQVTANNACTSAPLNDPLALPLQSEVREINVGNNKWGLFVKPSVEWEGNIFPMALFGESNIDLLGKVEFDLCYVWAQEVKLLNEGLEHTSSIRAP